MNTKEKGISIFKQAAAASMLVLFMHYLVRAIPGALRHEGAAVIFVPTLAALLCIGMVLVLFNKKFGLIFGFLNGVWMIFQPIMVHIINGAPDINGVWWYPSFPWTLSLLVIYFCCAAWKNWDKPVLPNEKGLSIYLQVAAAIMLMVFVFQAVRSIPNTIPYGGMSLIVISGLTAAVFIGMVLVLLKQKAGLTIAFIISLYRVIMPIMVHVVNGKPDINGIWWYPILPWTLGILMLYFSWIAWKNWKKTATPTGGY